jgi:hypothetical protein
MDIDIVLTREPTTSTVDLAAAAGSQPHRSRMAGDTTEAPVAEADAGTTTTRAPRQASSATRHLTPVRVARGGRESRG